MSAFPHAALSKAESDKGTYGMKLLLKALIKFICGIGAICLVLFLPAGTLNYPNGLRFCGLLFIPMLILSIILFAKDKALLEKRLNTKEKENTQKLVILVSAVEFIGCFVAAGLDFRFKLTQVPYIVVVIASVLFVGAYAMYVEVMRENAYLSRTVEVQENQKVISTGLYGVVRHPMYSATLLLFLMMPLVLGSWIALIFMLPLPFILAKRIKNEEAILIDGLEGYAEYRTKVKYRMIPFIW